MGIRSAIIGTGSYLPDRVVTNDEMSEFVNTSDEWIRERTGIRQRHFAEEGQLTSDLALRAAERAIEAAGIDKQEIDLIVLATTTPDLTFPATAVTVQSKLDIHHGAAFDVQAVCSGFIYALSVANNFIKVGQSKTALVIGAETFSRLLDWSDRTTCVLFGDGAGAVVLKAVDDDGEKGILSTHIHSEGDHAGLLKTDGGPSSTGTVGKTRMEGREVFRHAVVNLAAVVDEALAANGLNKSDIDWLVPHQANLRILASTAKKLSLPEERVIITVDRHANTSAASVPLALDEGVRDGRIKPGDLILLEAMGGGFTWGAALARF